MTLMAETTIVEDLQALLNLEPEEGETQHEFAKRLAEKGFGVTEENWETLSEPTQSWINDTVTAVSEKKPISQLTLPSGIDGVIPAEPVSDPETGEIIEEPAPAKKPAKKKAPAKAPAKVAAKPAAAKPAAKPAVKAPAKKAAKTNGAPKAKVGPKGRFALTDKIKIVAKENPYRKGSKGTTWFAKYKDGMTVEAAIAANIPRHQVRWDIDHKHIKLA
jgi:pyruvate/2-oxoglutarate dehydrogenase complex dihydrolipoamide acyltransferase (E2) component